MPLATTERLLGRRRHPLLIVALAIAIAVAFAAPALAAPRWEITMTHANPYGQQASSCEGGKPQAGAKPCGIDPLTEGVGGEGKTFAQESGWNEYKIIVKNIGTEASSGTVTVVDHLPRGIVVAARSESEEAYGTGWSGGREPGACKILLDGAGVECTNEDEAKLAAGAAFSPITLHVNVTPEAANPSINQPSVEGGGAVPAKTTLDENGASEPTAKKESETTVTPAVPFGIQSFTPELFKAPGETETAKCDEAAELERAELEPSRASLSCRAPLAQAGAHPFRLSTSIVFKYTTSDREPELDPAGGAAKEVQAEVPPGVIGNPQNAPLCPIGLLPSALCPPDTAVGYIHASLANTTDGAKIVNGIAKQFPGGFQPAGDSGLVYDLQPSPGFPAQFGFVIDEGLTFVLDAKVRSDGDYGVTVGDSGSPNDTKPLAIKLTFCENGVGGSVPNFHCSAAAPSSKPFLSNGTECFGPAPEWRLFADPWDKPPGTEPGDYQKTTASVNQLSGESFVEGCEKLAFEPEIEAKPSSASENQAGKPTGLTVALRVPQHNEAEEKGEEGKATPELKNAVVTLPAGMTLSSSAAEGLRACSNSEFGLGTEFATAEVPLPPGVEPTEPARPASCPLASQIGEVEVFTPLLSGAPTIEGVPGKEVKGGVGELTCSPGTWKGSPTFAYKWLSDGKEIATGQDYTPVAADEGQALQCQVTATNAAGRSSVAVSRDLVGTVEPFLGEIEQASTIVKKVTSFTGVSIGSELSTFSVPTGATEGSIPVDATVVGVKEKEKEGKKEKELEMSLPASLPTKTEIERITPAPQPPFPPASIAAPSGTPSMGKTLTCESGAWASGPKHERFTGFTESSYKWLRGGEEIKAEGSPRTGREYTLESADVGQAIQCQVTGTNASGSVVADSAAVVASPSPEPGSAPPLLGAPLQGQLYVGEPECGNANYPEPCTNEDAENGKLVRVFLQAEDPLHCPSGSSVQTCAPLIIKQVGKGSLNTLTGQLTTTFKEAPQQPFELLQLRLKSGPRAPLTNPQSCGPATTTTDLTPWSAPGLGGPSGTDAIPGTPDAFPTSTYDVTGCTSQFAPTFNAGTSNNQAGAFTHLSLTFSRTDKDEDFEALTVHTPPGLAAMISNVELCHEAQANAGTCPAASQIGTTETGVGPGEEERGHPVLYLPGKVYLTGPYKGGPFGMSVVVPAVAGPFNLGLVVVRSSIHVDPTTAAVTVISDPFPRMLDGIPTHIREVNVNISREKFIFNPTNCSPQQISATITSLQGASAQVSSPFGITGCTGLPFKPTFTASTQAHTSKLDGASLTVKVTYPPGTYANIAKTVTDLPIQLPARLETLHKACIDTVFEANPAACPEGSVVGEAIAHTPVLRQPLAGPAYLVSHGNRAFPDLVFVLQGEGVTVVLDGLTDIKKGITRSAFETVPDQPVESFEVSLPEGPHAILAANEDLCAPKKTVTVRKSVAERRNGHTVHVKKTVTEQVPTQLIMPTKLVGQNGAVIKQNTVIAVVGCPPTVQITNTKLSGNTLLVTVKMSAKGTVKISGKGLKTTKKSLSAGTHQVRVALTNAGKSLRRHHKSTSVHVSLTVGKQAAAKTTSVRL
jgi:hypothetical protein